MFSYFAVYQTVFFFFFFCSVRNNIQALLVYFIEWKKIHDSILKKKEFKK